jgi:hypothetical protein
MENYRLSQAPTPGQDRAARIVMGAILVAALLAIAGVMFGCATGSVTTSTGAVVPAATVQAQDTAADVLKLLSDAYSKAVAVHDSRVAIEDATTHAQHRALLLQVHSGLDAAYAAMISWKQASTGSAVPVTVLAGLKSSLPDFLNLAVSFKLLTQTQADQITAFAGPILAGV